MKKVMAVALAFLAIYLLAVGSVFVAMHQTPARFARFMTWLPMPMMMVLPFETLWNRARAGLLEVGDPAPDFELPTLDRSGTVRLSSFRGKKPVVLVFGSYT